MPAPSEPFTPPTDTHRRVISRLERLATRYATKSAVRGLRLAVAQPSTGLRWSWGATDQPYPIASITKLFTTAVVMQLRAEGALRLSTPVVEILGEEAVGDLVVIDGVDHAAAITVEHLLSHTSGIPDYFDERGPDGLRLGEQMLTDDRSVTFEEMLARARQLPAVRAPGAATARYSDTNFQLLGRIVEVLTGQGFVAAVQQRIGDPLGLSDTWHVTADDLDRYQEAAPVYLGKTALHVPWGLASTAPDGGMVSTTNDQLRFLHAFVRGELFPRAYLDEMAATPRKLTGGFGPIRYGIGLMHLTLPRWQTLGAAMPALIGHSGSFGTVLFHAPSTDLFVAGTVSQVRPASLPYPLLARVAMTVRGSGDAPDGA